MLDQMRAELLFEGFDVNVVAVNQPGAESSQASLSAKCEFPLFQDTDEVGAWDLHQGAKDDIVIYRPDGTLHVFIPYGEEIPSNLSEEDGYATVKDFIQEAATW